ncbi:type II toxin-antitoxin system RelE/ParE family toxin [Geminicoccaceae bacterium 1502E]|nr:type II toxin-antitoxin system RelE/ParE family toxin [Geminicoccaceae bacterium 1502E]
MRWVVWSQDALADLNALVVYIAKDNRTAASLVADRIEKAVLNLAFMPTGRQGRVTGTYEKPVPDLPYILSYALATAPSGEERLVVLRVIHEARNWPAGKWPDA